MPYVVKEYVSFSFPLCLMNGMEGSAYAICLKIVVGHVWWLTVHICKQPVRVVNFFILFDSKLCSLEFNLTELQAHMHNIDKLEGWQFFCLCST